MSYAPKGYSAIQSPMMSPQATDQLQGMRSQLNPYASQLIDILGAQGLGSDGSSQMEYIKNAFRQLRQGPMAQIYENLGRRGSGKSSGLNNALAASQSNVEGSLLERTQERQDRALRDLLGLQSQLLGMHESEYGFVQKPQSTGKMALQGLLSSLPNLAGLLKSLF